ncbi:MAG: ABC transporter ATP-binding protein [Candidatus Firestonebacteria bacterium]|nr:ABC transporter ATP-binding protein [Candidatus Firestonebacteria bacterium]
MMISIRLTDLRKSLGANQALAGVTDVFEPALLHGVIGPDGAGKTTLLRTLMGLLRPDGGTVEYLADGLLAGFADVRPQFAYMPQQQSLYPDLSVSEHLDFFRDLYRIPAAVYVPRRRELLHLTRLEPFADRPASKLSGGMYKKLGLMCALLQSPSVVLLDEPTNGVDPISRREFWDLLYRLVKEKILVIVSTAYMDEAERCSRVHVLDAGRLLASGEPRAVLQASRVDNFEKLFLKKAQAGRT